MKLFRVILIWIVSGNFAQAQTNDEVDWSATLNSAQQWAQSNLDEDVVKSLQQVDRTRAEDFLKNYQTYLNGHYVLDMGQLKTAANAALPLLIAHPETRDYGAWLRARLDYFAAAEEMTLSASRLETNAPANPSFKTEQEIWVKKISPQPWSPAATEFVPKLKPIFAAEGVPPELVWLAEVESGFDSTTRSPSGALGMFQLMPATAKDLGLNLWPRDQRRQPEVAAQAAAKYLRQLHSQFGDWRLAVAAYNCGPGAVQKLLTQRSAKNYEAIATRLPAETQMYVPKVEATILHHEGLELEKLKMPEARL